MPKAVETRFGDRRMEIRFADEAAGLLRELGAEQEGMDALGTAADLQVGNDAPYAGYLERHGYTVVSEEVVLQELTRALTMMMASRLPMTKVRVRSVTALAAYRSVARMLYFTGKLRPPLRAGGPQRPAHRGGWADRTTTLASSYFWRWHRLGAKRRVDYHGTRYA